MYAREYDFEPSKAGIFYNRRREVGRRQKKGLGVVFFLILALLIAITLGSCGSVPSPIITATPTAPPSQASPTIIPYGHVVASIAIPASPLAYGTKKVEVQIKDAYGDTIGTQPCYVRPGEALTMEYLPVPASAQSAGAGIRLVKLDGCYASAYEAAHQSGAGSIAINGGTPTGVQGVEKFAICIGQAQTGIVDIYATQDGLAVQGLTGGSCS